MIGKTCAALLTACVGLAGFVSAQEPVWPDVVRAMKPWAVNWWLGGAVDKGGLEAQAKIMDDAGIGGLHIVPAYGAKGFEGSYRAFLSPSWMEAFNDARHAASPYNLGVDLSMGFGGPFAGPQLKTSEGCWMVQITGDRNRLTHGDDPLASHILWEGEDRDGRQTILSVRPTGRKTRHAGPGGEGPVMDPFSKDAMESLLKMYSAAFDAPKMEIPDHMHHGTADYSGAGWTPDMFPAFLAKRGYDLRDFLAEFAGAGDREIAARVKCDYRETLSDLMVEDVFPVWTEWCVRRSIRTRFQANGASANLLDLYAVADMPDAASCGVDAEEGLTCIPAAKFASSAAHVKSAITGEGGNVRVAGEVRLPLKERYRETLEGVKAALDGLFLSGVTRVYYKGFCYSPEEAGWPGWSFARGSELNPRNPLWRDFGALNEAVARIQSLLLTARSDSDILVYWPVHDLWMDPDGYEMPFLQGSGEWFDGHGFGRIVRELYDLGYSFDYVSDRQLRAISALSAETLAGTTYRIVLVPSARYIPAQTMVAFAGLAGKGVKIVFAERYPESVPGLKDVKAGEARMKAVLDAMDFPVGRAQNLLRDAGARREPFNAEAGLAFVRYRMPHGARVYYIVNRSKPLAAGEFEIDGSRATLMNPFTGVIEPLKITDSKIHLSLPAGNSTILVVDDEKETREIPERPRFDSFIDVKGPWRMTAVCGHPADGFQERTVDSLDGWQNLPDGSPSPFSGTVAYEASFSIDKEPASGRAGLMLGKVCESARVFLNGREIGVVYLDPKELSFDSSILVKGVNNLRIEVTGTAANGIKDLDARHVDWRCHSPQGLPGPGGMAPDASRWPLARQGLFGPVRVVFEGR